MRGEREAFREGVGRTVEHRVMKVVGDIEGGGVQGPKQGGDKGQD